MEITTIEEVDSVNLRKKILTFADFMNAHIEYINLHKKSRQRNSKL